MYVPNPQCLASIVSYLGLTIATVSLFSLALLVMIFPLYNYLAGYEEKYGEAYRNYKKKTGKWEPKISRRSQGCMGGSLAAT
jgi:protein-S-isoprenylcysteine O-methyltransferase Ste14